MIAWLIKNYGIVGLILLLVCGVTSHSLVDAQEVGNWSDPDRLVIEGNKTFTSDDIRDTLLQNLNVVEDGDQHASLNGYRNSLTQKVASGYLHAGFPHVKVDSHLDEDKKQLILTIDEGQRFVCGNVVVTDASIIAMAEIESWLIHEQPPADAVFTGFSNAGDKQTGQWADSSGQATTMLPPAWRPGKAARFDEDGIKVLHEGVQRALAEQGLPWAQFDVEILPDDTTGKVALTIHITNSGPQAVVENINVVGSKRDTQEDVLNYLAIKAGTVITESEREQIWHKLWLSGRYLKHDVQLQITAQSKGKVELQITLVDNDLAPPLAKSLTQVEEALMKCREWACASVSRGDDWVCKFNGPINFCAVLSPTSGLLIHVAARSAEDQNFHELLGQSSWPEIVFILTPEHVLYADSLSAKKLMFPFYGYQLTSDIKLEADDDPGDTGHHFRLALGWGISTSPQNQMPVDLRMGIPPAAVYDYVDSHCEIKDRTVEITNTNELGKLFKSINLCSGRLNVFRWEGLDHISQFEITAEHGAFQREMEQVDKHLQNLISKDENAFDSQRPMTSIAEFLLNDPAVVQIIKTVTPDSQPDEAGKLCVALRNAIAAGLLEPVDQAIATSSKKHTDASNEESDDSFILPDEFESLSEMAKFFWGMEHLVLLKNDRAFQRRSAPWTIVRSGTLWYSQRSKYLNDNIKGLCAQKDFGPLEHYFLACTFNGTNSSAYDEWVRLFAQDGLNKLGDNDFKNEMASFLDRTTVCGECFYHFAKVLQKLSEDDANVIGHLCCGESGSLLGDAARRLRQNKDKPLETVVPALLEQIWADNLKATVEKQLHELSKSSEEVAQKPTDAVVPSTDAASPR